MSKAALALGLAALAGCATTIRPPARPADPVLVVLLDYGKHSSLVLPQAAGSVEYAYGEWDYFALNQDDVCTGLAALACFNQGALGRRFFDVPPERAVLGVGRQEHHELSVARADVDALRRKLETRYAEREGTKVVNRLNGLAFVKDDESYICFNNCNHVIARWLEELGCEVRGGAFFSDFVVELTK